MLAPIKSRSRSSDNSMASDRVMTSTDEGVSGPSSITKRTVTLSPDDSPAFLINREISSSLEMTLLSCLPFLAFPPFRRDEKALRVSKHFPISVVELYILFECNDGLHEDPQFVGKLPPAYIDNGCNGIVEKFLLDVIADKDLVFLELLWRIGGHFVNVDGRERMARQGAETALKSLLVDDILSFSLEEIQVL